MARVILLTGGNLGDVRATLAGARLKLAERVGAETAASSLWESPPWGFEAPEQFLNQVLIFETALEPEHVLDICQQIEREAGRIRPRAADDIATGTGCQAGAGCNKTAGADHEAMGRQYGSRTLDIEILFYDDRVIDTPRLTVPHPLMQQRGFVLRPLCEVLPGFMHPVLHKSVRQLLDELSE